MQGKIVKGIAGFYYVQTEEKLYECKAKGVFRNEKIKPLVGDDVEIEILDEEKKTGNVAQILPRKNHLIRPAVANVDQALVIFSVCSPDPNLNLLDRFLLHMEKLDLDTIICFNKQDLQNDEDCEKKKCIYELAGYKTLLISAKQDQGIETIKKELMGKTTTVAGPSGVGKSSIINCLSSSGTIMETGDISEKIQRGKHTTRHSQLIPIDKDTYIMDTPGFSSLGVEAFEKEELKYFYREFTPFEEQCRFYGCMHDKEPDCGVKQAVADGKIAKERYENYLLLYQELSDKKRKR